MPSLSMRCSSVATLVVFLAGAACGPRTTIVPEQRPIRLPTGEPRSACETRRFLNLVPATGFAEATRESNAGWGWVRVDTREERVKGLGVFRGGDALDLREVLPQLGEPELAELHIGRLQPIQDKKDARWGWLWAALGLGAISLGLVTAATVPALQDSDFDDSSYPLLGAAAGVALAMLIPGLISLSYRPSTQEETYFELRRRLLLPEEDDFDAAARGVNRYNARVRAKCRP